MKQTLLACLLVLAGSTQLLAHGAGGEKAATSSSESQLAAKSTLLTGKTLAGQDTARFGHARGAQLTIAGTHPRLRNRLATGQKVDQLDHNLAAVLNAAGEFDLEAANLPATLAITLRRPEAPLGRHTYRTRRVRTGRFATHHETVEILTCTYAGPLVLAQVPATEATPTRLFVGPGYDQTIALRPLALTPEAVLRLCGSRAPQVQAYARLYNLHFEQADEVARLLDYYNRIAVTVNE